MMVRVLQFLIWNSTNCSSQCLKMAGMGKYIAHVCPRFRSNMAGHSFACRNFVRFYVSQKRINGRRQIIVLLCAQSLRSVLFFSTKLPRTQNRALDYSLFHREHKFKASSCSCGTPRNNSVTSRKALMNIMSVKDIYPFFRVIKNFNMAIVRTSDVGATLPPCCVRS
jgi:hypothetical protein